MSPRDHATEEPVFIRSNHPLDGVESVVGSKRKYWEHSVYSLYVPPRKHYSVGTMIEDTNWRSVNPDNPGGVMFCKKMPYSPKVAHVKVAVEGVADKLFAITKVFVTLKLW